MICKNCGKVLEVNSRFCSSCGSPIQNSNPSMIGENKPSKKSICLDINKILIFAIALLVTIIVIGTAYTLVSRGKSRTIMIYMVGSNLETDIGLGTRDLLDIDYEKIEANHTKVILMAGGSSTWHNNYIDSTETSIYELKESGFVKVEKRKRTNMGSVDNLSYFLNYGYDNYKSSKYDFIFWDHGGAVDGSEYDDLESGDNLKLTEMQQAFQNSPFNKNNKLEVISFRTCLNATIEVANLYKDYAKYLVASEEVTMGSKLDSALSFINEIKASDNGEEYGKKQVEGYKSTITTYCNYLTKKDLEENFCVDFTYSVVDLSKIENLNKAFHSFSKDLNTNLTKNYNNIARIRANRNQYASDCEYYDMIDLYDFVESMEPYSQNAQEVLKEIEKAVIYNSTNNNYSHGLSIYFPYNSAAFLSNYEKISVSSNYTNFTKNFYNLKNNKNVDSFSNFSMTTGEVKRIDNNKADFEIELTDEQVDNFAKALYLVFVDTKDGYYQLLYSGKDIVLEDNKLKATVQGKMLRFSDIEYEDENCWITVIEEEVTNDYIEVVTVPILKRGLFGSEVATMTIRIDKEHPNGYITSVVVDDDSEEKDLNISLFSKVGVDIRDFTYVEFVSQRYKILDSNGKFDSNFATNGNGIYRGMYLPVDQFRFIKEDFDSEYDYYAVFKILDTAGNINYSNIVKMK